MKKYLKIVEYSTLGKYPKAEQNEHLLKNKDKIIYSSIVESDIKENIKDTNDPFYINSLISSDEIPLDDIIIYDDKSIDKTQEIAYVLTCPICLYTIITSKNDLDICPQCENIKFPFELKALINIEQMKEIEKDA